MWSCLTDTTYRLVFLCPVWQKINHIRQQYLFIKKIGIISQQTQRNKHVIITSKRRFDVMIACLLRYVFAGINITHL